MRRVSDEIGPNQLVRWASMRADFRPIMPRLAPQTLRAFVADAREGRVSRAALRLHLAAQTSSPYRPRPPARFGYRVLASPGWGPQVRGKDWTSAHCTALAGNTRSQCPPPASTAGVGLGSTTGLAPRRVALVDQAASLLGLVMSGVGFSLLRGSIAIRAAQQRIGSGFIGSALPPPYADIRDSTSRFDLSSPQRLRASPKFTVPHPT